jgi:8-oxo-dGTP pyrophosphatase MutT (NUDIX family)
MKAPHQEQHLSLETFCFSGMLTRKHQENSMHRQSLLKSLEEYLSGPFFTEEEKHHHVQLTQFITDNPDCFERGRIGHICGSAWIINHEQTHALLTHHKKLDSWFQLGGHADGDPDIPAVALKEAYEESGIEGLTLYGQAIYDIDVHPIPNKCAVHYDVRYLILAPYNAQYVVSDESHDLAWVPLNKITDYTSSRSVLRMAEKMRFL